MPASRLAAPLLAVVLLASGCRRETAPPPPAPSAHRPAAPATGPDGVAFATDLYQQLRGTEGNLVCSPHSAWTALAMAYAGARGETAKEMAQALHFAGPPAELHAAFQRTQAALRPAPPAKPRGAWEPGPVVFTNANSLWVGQGYPLNPEFQRLLDKRYGAPARTVDFATSPGRASETINRWVAEQTRARIPRLLAPTDVNQYTPLVLVNAVYLKAAWLQAFEPNTTQPGRFHRLRGADVRVPLMHQRDQMRYAEGEGWQAVALPYSQPGWSMLVLLPRPGKFAAVEQALDANLLSGTDQALDSREVILTLPRFEYECRMELVEPLQRMGMRQAFAERIADFKGMGPGDLCIDKVIQQAVVAVDEEGTEAAAATAVIPAPLCDMPGPPPPPPVEVTADRPFLFVIRHEPTGAILFLGRVTDPSAGVVPSI